MVQYNNTVQHSAVWYSIVQCGEHSRLWHSTVWYSTVEHGTVKFSTYLLCARAVRELMDRERFDDP